MNSKNFMALVEHYGTHRVEDGFCKFAIPEDKMEEFLRSLTHLPAELHIIVAGPMGFTMGVQPSEVTEFLGYNPDWKLHAD